MSQKYLGDNFDIHGGGLENAFPHHECEIAQAEANTGKSFANYWLHNNMVTINGQKMGKSLGNGIFCHELFSGENHQLSQAYSPMTIRFFILQSHYRSTLDFSNEALIAAEKGLKRLMKAIEMLPKLEASNQSSFEVNVLKEKLYEAMDDDFNSPIAIAHLFEAVKHINLMMEGKASLTQEDLKQFQELVQLFTFDILGLKSENSAKNENDTHNISDNLMQMILEFRAAAKENKDFVMADKIRDRLKEMDIQIKDSKDGASWEYEN